LIGHESCWTKFIQVLSAVQPKSWRSAASFDLDAPSILEGAGMAITAGYCQIRIRSYRTAINEKLNMISVCASNDHPNGVHGWSGKAHGVVRLESIPAYEV